MDRETVAKIKSVRIQISNLCNMSEQHVKCPAHYVDDDKCRSMPSRTVSKILQDLADIGFTGNVGFHTYNDPLVDPRLFSFIDWSRVTLPKSDVVIYTNGEYLTDIIVAELIEKRVRIIVSTYTQHTADLCRRFGLETCSEGFDDRLNGYARAQSEYRHPCYAPLSQLIIDVDGNVNLCCFDWASSVCFGDVNKSTIKEILAHSQMTMTYDRLKVGIRDFDICNRCATSR